MFTFIYLCLAMFTRVTYVYHSLLVHVSLPLRMFTVVTLCLPLFNRVYLCLHFQLIFAHV